ADDKHNVCNLLALEPSLDLLGVGEGELPDTERRLTDHGYPTATGATPCADDASVCRRRTTDALRPLTLRPLLDQLQVGHRYIVDHVLSTCNVEEHLLDMNVLQVRRKVLTPNPPLHAHPLRRFQHLGVVQVIPLIGKLVAQAESSVGAEGRAETLDDLLA